MSFQRKIFSLIIICTVLSFHKSKAQAFQYFSYTFSGSIAALSNYKYIPIQQQAYFMGGFDFGFSLTQYSNFEIGLQYLGTYMNFGKLNHSICEQEGVTCFAESEVKYINLPMAYEMYQNGGKTSTKSYYKLKLVPMFSFNEKQIKSEIFEVPDVRFEIDTFENSNIKFQDLHLGFAFGSDISLSRKFKLFFEPSFQHSILFRKEDLINPNYIISIKLGMRIRSYRR